MIVAVEIGGAFLLLMVAEGLVKPLAVKLFDAWLLPTASDVFAKHINIEMGQWLSTMGSAEELTDAIIAAITDEDPSFADKSKKRQMKAVERIAQQYNPLTNLKKKAAMGVSAASESVYDSVESA